MNFLITRNVSFARVSHVRSKKLVGLKSAAAPTRIRRFAVCAKQEKVEVFKKVREVIHNQLAVEKDNITPDTKLSDLGADSLDTVEIIMALEEEFQIEIAEDDAEKISTVKQAADLISKQIEKA